MSEDDFIGLRGARDIAAARTASVNRIGTAPPAQGEIERIRLILAHTDIGSLPNDWTLTQIAEARIDDLLKLRDQVRDTCRRAELAEAALARSQEGRDAVIEECAKAIIEGRNDYDIRNPARYFAARVRALQRGRNC